MKKLTYLLIFTFLSFSFTSCDDDETMDMEQMEEMTTVVDIATGNEDLSILVAALTRADLVSALQGPGPFTVFAPTNDAFTALLASNDDWDGLDDIPLDVLTSVLLYHVVPGKVASSDLTTGYITTLNETGPNGTKPSLLVDVTSGVVLNGNTTVTTANSEADNGIVHIIDNVLLPPDVTDIAIDNANYSLLVEALIKADLVSTLKTAGPFTILAPDNTAFENLFAALGVNGIDDIDIDLLTNVLLNHVISGSLLSTDLSTGYSNTLANGVGNNKASIYISVDGGVTFNGASEVVLANIGATNGTVHAVDEVILVPNVVEFAIANPGFSSLVAAVTRADLNDEYVNLLTGDGPFTVFAPTNAAFDALLASNDDWNTLADIDVDVLKAVLNYHVVVGNVRAEDLTDDMMVATSGGDTFVVDLDNAIPQINTLAGQTVDIIATNVQGSNGVIHAVDEVLIPIP